MTGLIDEDAGMINQNTGLIENSTGMMENSTGMMENSTGMMENSTGMMENSTGMITKTDDTKYTVNGRRKRRKERGKDSKPRNFPLHTMKNLPQFRNKSHEEFRQHILKTKGVDIGSNFDWNSITVWILIGLVVTAIGIGIAKWCQQRQMKKQDRKPGGNQ